MITYNGKLGALCLSINGSLRGNAMLKLLMLCVGVMILMMFSEGKHTAKQGYWIENRHFMDRHMDGYMLAAVVWMTCFAFLRTNYNDTTSYINGFRNAQTLAQGFELGTYFDWMENPLSAFYRDLMRVFTDNYHVYFLFPAVLQCIGVVKLFKYHSENPTMSILLYFCLGTYVMLNLAAFKQGTAMGILLIALPYARQKKYGRYVALVLLATLFHFYAIVYLLLPLLFGEPWGKGTWIMVAIAVATLLTYDETLGALMASVDEMGGDIAAEELFDGNSINLLRVAVYWVPGLMALVFRRYVAYHSTRTENLIVNGSVLCACILTIGLAQGANLYGRMAGYFEIYLALAVPLVIKKIFTRDSARFVSVVAALLFLGYFYYEFTVAKLFGSEYRAISLLQFILELMKLR